MNRREFAGLLAGAAVWPAVAAAQRALPVVGLLHAGAPEENSKRLQAFARGFAATGFVDGQNVIIEYRWARGRNEALADMAADLVRRNVAMIVTPGSTAAAVAAKRATSTIPIVFSSGADPVALGLVASLNRPGGNATGITSLNSELAAKRLGVFRELSPQTRRYFTLVKPTSELAAPFVADLTGAAGRLGVKVEVLKADTAAEIEAAFAAIPPEPGCGLIFGPEGFFYIHRSRIAGLALQRRLPTIFDVRDYVDAGGLASYGSDYFNVTELTGSYAGRVLRGEKPSDLPVQQATRFELVINRKTAKALGLELPPMLLATADEVLD